MQKTQKNNNIWSTNYWEDKLYGFYGNCSLATVTFELQMIYAHFYYTTFNVYIFNRILIYKLQHA